MVGEPARLLTGRERDAQRLLPYVSTLALAWLRDHPDQQHQQVSGSLAFVDISGFTALTEKLARSGKAGAEELTEILDATFAQLLDVAYTYGAQLIKWGGDAVLLLYTEDGHEGRACRAAAERRALLRRLGRLSTSVGRATLRMSVGISSGEFDFFLVGARHRELLIAGPRASEAARLESVAVAGQILISPATAAAVERRAVGPELQPGMHLLAAAPKAHERPRRSSFELGDLDPGMLLPASTRDHLLAGGTDGEHRQVAVGFLEFSGVDALLARGGPTAAASALHEVVSLTQQSCERHGVSFWETDINADGGKIMLTAGAHRSTGDDAGAMLAVARDVLDARPALPVRLGINYGRVFGGDFGPPYRRTASIKGDAVNLAARVMGKAAIGEAWVTETALRAARLGFATDRLAPFAVKGKTAPVQAFRLGPARAATTADGPTDLALVGRRHELDRLVALASESLAGRGHVVELVGEAGSGKSRLVLELTSRTPERALLAVACDSYQSSTPYAPVRSMLRQAANVAEDEDPLAVMATLSQRLVDAAPQLVPWMPLLAAVLGTHVPSTPAVEALDERFRKTRTEQLLLEAFGALLPDPAILVVEDLQHADAATLDVLTRLRDEVGSHPWLVCVTSRAPAPLGDGLGAAAGSVETLPLGPLSPADATALLRAATAEAPLHPHHVAALIARAGGNPLFLLQLASAVAESGGVADLPSSIEGLISARIDRLSPSERRLLRAASVLGVVFSLETLRELVRATAGEADDSWSAVDWDRGPLSELLHRIDARSGRFRQALVRETAYEGLPYRRRRELHAVAGDVLERFSTGRLDTVADLLSLHFLEAGASDKAWTYARLAATGAQRAAASAQAEIFLVRALRAARGLSTLPPGELGDVLESLGDVRTRLGEMRRADATYAEARRAAGGPVAVARVLRKQADLRIREGRHVEALRWLRRGLTALEGDGSPEAKAARAQLQSYYGLVRHNQGRAAEGARWCREAVAEAEASESPAALAEALLHLDVCLTFDDPSDHGVHAERALDLWRKLGNAWQEARTLNQLGIRAYFSGRWDDALRHYRAAAEAFDRSGDLWMASVTRGNVAETRSDQGASDEAAGIFRDLLDLWRASGAPTMVGFGTSLLARACARSGLFDEAESLYNTAALVLAEHGEPVEVLENDARIAELD
ncbi:MAG: adenylate/guanylate cyclase domain-containing protein, partial [Actinomycetes bacterium]